MWNHSAAEGGNCSAQFKVGTLLLEGTAFQADPAEAVRWLHQAAEQVRSSSVRCIFENEETSTSPF